MPQYNKSAAEVVLTMLHAGGKFGGAGYKVSGGLHGVGVSVVNALSEWLELDIYATASTGTSASSAACRSRSLEKQEKLDKNAPTGTTVSFMPDPDVFEEVDYDYRVLAQRLRETAFLTKNLRIELIDERAEGETTVFQYAGGMRDFVDYINRDKDPVHRTVIYFENETPDGQVEVAMQWNSSYNDSIFTFANNINTTEGGAHLSGFRGALTRTINDYARQKGLLKEKEENLTGEDVREGLTAIVSVKLKNPQFEGQTKTKLGNTEIRTLVETTVNDKLAEFLEENPAEGAPDRRQVGQRGAGPQRRAQGARPHAPQGPARRLHACPASWPTAPSATRTSASSTWSRATRPAARPSRPATAASRPSCRCAARSSTSRRRASTRCCRTTRSSP